MFPFLSKLVITFNLMYHKPKVLSTKKPIEILKNNIEKLYTKVYNLWITFSGKAKSKLLNICKKSIIVYIRSIAKNL